MKELLKQPFKDRNRVPCRWCGYPPEFAWNWLHLYELTGTFSDAKVCKNCFRTYREGKA